MKAAIAQIEPRPAPPASPWSESATHAFLQDHRRGQANAYGHGLLPVARALVDADAYARWPASRRR